MLPPFRVGKTKKPSIDFVGLEENQFYVFFVAAENAEGWNKDRNHFLVRTLSRSKGELFVWGNAQNNQLSLLPE